MTKEEWAQVEEQLKHLFHSVTLLCDGYRLQLQLSRISDMSLGITFFVNGWMRGEWWFQDCEERRRFFRPTKHAAYKEKDRKLYRKMGSRFLKEHKIDLNKTLTGYSFHWTSFRSLKAHLVQHNQSIELAPLDTANHAGDRLEI